MLGSSSRNRDNRAFPLSHVCGRNFVLEALEKSLREGSGKEPTQPPLPMHTDRISPEVQRIYEVTAMLELAERTAGGFSGDEDSLAIVEKLTTPAGAVRSARRLLMEVAEHLQVAAHEAEGGESPA